MRAAREGLAVVIEAVRGKEVVPQRILAEYRFQLFGRGESKGEGEEGKPKRLGVSPERIEEVLEMGGKLDAWESVRCRVRYFSDGFILGSRAFVERYFGENRWRFGKRRVDGARRMKHVNFPALFTMRDLQKAPIG